LSEKKKKKTGTSILNVCLSLKSAYRGKILRTMTFDGLVVS